MGLLLFVLSLLLSSCGYQLGDGAFIEEDATVSIAYVENDPQGYLTESLIEQLALSGLGRYVHCGGKYRLSTELIDKKNEPVDYRYAEDRDGKRINFLAVTGYRLTVTVRFSLIDNRSGCMVLGPIELSENLVYDAEADLDRQVNTQFSLGQLAPKSLAEETAVRPLYTLLAKKMIDYIRR